MSLCTATSSIFAICSTIATTAKMPIGEIQEIRWSGRFYSSHPMTRRNVRNEICYRNGNAHKVEEFSRMLKFLDFSAVSAEELGIDMDKAVENGDTFEQNALIKAKYACEKSGLAAFADDSGLCVDALDGRPGIYSARYAKTDALRIEKLLCELEGVEKEKERQNSCRPSPRFSRRHKLYRQRRNRRANRFFAQRQRRIRL